MAITGSTDMGNGLLVLTVDHDPTSVSTDAPKGSIIISSDGVHCIKQDDGATTNVTTMIESGSSAYTTNATVVEDRTLLASASATIINNNNVLAALIADLKASNLIS